MTPDATPMPASKRRRALALGHVNGGLWAMGNALSTGPLIVYLARDMGATGLGISLVLAAPSLSGLLRLLAPAIVYRAGTARRACLIVLLASYLLLTGLPMAAALRTSISPHVAVAVMIGLLFLHQLLEYIGTVALWAWWGDLVPARVRGRYFARRQMIQLAVSIPTLLASGYFADQWREQFGSDPERLLLAYVYPTGLGALCLLGSLVPLVLMPATRRYPRPGAALAWSAARAPFADPRFARLLIFRCWFSLANGISQTVQNAIVPKELLGFGVLSNTAMRTVTQGVQLAGSRPVGKLSDRFGNRPVLIAAQACVSLALVFYIVARPETRWLLAGAWVLFGAYVAHNICLPNLVLKLSPELERPAYVATNEALASVCHAAATVAGGLLFDLLAERIASGSAVYQSCLIILFTGFFMRSAGIVLLAGIDEPGAWTWREILAGQRGISPERS